ncbi:anaphase-promoting complex APC subunit CDC26 domain-containing protein [Trichoderma breve]|uniref:Anaphase-promoting complex APC subunit CDC26 domain-containing protein n=1 Tax=Trichoderma breve TaxID=2034170 RepID=A0A9W9EAD0_9HYPO|nr:anaphase-promoting complex APC subunit CDC26 domain-containing protein [Trichoderma breve]KAJ4862926.1 anaphase-promoting complex APC subunit CDC26 domain-containing protein [Trichoderma breve]
MLRRPPTTLQITAEDIAAYEDRRASEALLAAQQAHAAEVQARATSKAGGTGGGANIGGGGGAEAATQQTTAAMGDLGLGQAMEGVQEDAEGRARRNREERNERIGVGRRAR